MRTAEASQQYSTLKTAFQNINGVNVVSAISSVPSTPLTTDWGIYKKGATPDQMIFHDIVRVDADYFSALDIDIPEGRDFITGQDNIPADTVSTTKVIVNEASLKAFGIPVAEAVGASIYFSTRTGGI